jgi:thiol-disulfide isomerase/thioredoxin
VVASSLDAREIAEIGMPRKANDAGYLAEQGAQLFTQGMSFSGNERDKLWLNRGVEGFADLSDLSGADSPNDGRAVVACDFDDDGDVDLFVHQIQRERHSLWRNDAGTPGVGAQRFVKLRLRATSSQYEAIGAIVVLSTKSGRGAQVLSRGAGYASCQAPELIFGLGSDESATVEVIWPGARRESFGTLAANSRAVLVEGLGKPELFAAKPRPLPDSLPAGLKLAIGEEMPALQLVDGAGKALAFDARALAAGKPLYVNFWATWCAPCVAEIPDLQRLHEQGAVRVVTIGLDASAQRSKADALLRSRSAKFAAYYASDESALAGIVDLDRLPLPTTLVLSADGRLQSIIRGPIAQK